jgi:hypothetical protein
MEGEGDPIIRPLFAFVGAVIPNFNPTFGRFSLRIGFVEWFELQRMILHLNRQTLETGLFRQTFRDRPALEHAIFLEAKVKVMTSGPMLLDYENRKLSSLPLIVKTNTCLLNFLVWQKPREGFVVKVDRINPVAERVAEGASKSGN